MSDEHLWSTWLARTGLIPLLSEHVELRGTKPRNSNPVISKFDKQGGAQTKRVKVVCTNCNNTWMSRREKDVKPYLIPLIKGEKADLTEIAQTTIAQWIFMKVLVAENDVYRHYAPDPIFNQITRDSFRISGKIPKGVKIGIGIHTGEEKWSLGFQRHAAGLISSPTPPEPSFNNLRPKNIQTVTWGIGKLIIYFSAVLDPGMERILTWNPDWPLIQIWPRSVLIRPWPPTRTFHPTAIDRLAAALEEFIFHNDPIWMA
ncbi:hypothetical protein [Nitrospirillum viridazoti]|uniref:hypothetical protein n=1 Tax=Nitrospirillum viridazoti TaxID=3144925 RepID=UPI0011AAAF76|nr:hypothetical protein [Nitrospirillum amazonense]